jgi:hypothetical protein
MRKLNSMMLPFLVFFSTALPDSSITYLHCLEPSTFYALALLSLLLWKTAELDNYMQGAKKGTTRRFSSRTDNLVLLGLSVYRPPYRNALHMFLLSTTFHVVTVLLSSTTLVL